MLLLMLLERNKQGTRFILNERLRASIYRRHNKTMHSSFITFWAAVRSCTHSGQNNGERNNFIAKVLFQVEAFFKKNIGVWIQSTDFSVVSLKHHVPLVTFSSGTKRHCFAWSTDILKIEKQTPGCVAKKELWVRLKSALKPRHIKSFIYQEET